MVVVPSSMNPNGASLIVFFDDGNPLNNRDVVVFEGNDSNIFFGGISGNPMAPPDPQGWNVALSGINYTAGTAGFQLHVADGQPFGDDALVLNATTLVPTGNVFDGSSVPSPGAASDYLRLWDVKNYDVTSYMSLGPNTLTLTTGVNSDCLGLIVAIVDLPAGAAPEQPNDPPIADAGADVELTCAPSAGMSVTLDGTASSDPNGDALTYSWAATGIVFDDPSSATPTALFPPGTTTVTLTVDDGNGGSDTDDVQVTVVADTTPPVVSCVETNNPSGKNIPTAGKNPKSGQNPDGFYLLLASDDCDPAPAVYIKDSVSGFVAGPFSSGVKVKITQAPGAPPSVKPMAGDVPWHIMLNGDAVLMAIDANGNAAECSCLVPPPPK